jgi:hypothetical protein
VGYHHDVLAALHLHDDGFQPDHHVEVGLAAVITIVVSSQSRQRESRNLKPIKIMNPALVAYPLFSEQPQ